MMTPAAAPSCSAARSSFAAKVGRAATRVSLWSADRTWQCPLGFLFHLALVPSNRDCASDNGDEGKTHGDHAGRSSNPVDSAAEKVSPYPEDRRPENRT